MQSAERVSLLNFQPETSKANRQSLWSLKSGLDSKDKSVSVAGSMLNGAMLALAWAILFRLWMRLISDKPEFTISGTSILLGASMFVGMCAGLAFAVRRRGVSQRAWIARALAICSFALLCIGPGIFVVPTILFATLALTRKTWHVLLRIACAVIALAGFLMVTKIMLSFWAPIPSAIYLLLYLIFLYPAMIAMRVGVEARPAQVESAA